MAGTPLATAFVRIRPDTAGFQKESAAQMAKAGKESGKTFGAGFGASFKSMLASGAGLLGIAGVALSFRAITEEGGKLQKSTVLLAAAERAHGLALKATAPLIAAAIRQGAKYGQTQDVIQNSLVKLINAGVPMAEAVKVQQAALNVAAVTGQDYSEVLGKMTMGGGTAARTLKALGVTQATGATEAKALEAASKLLNDRITQSGGLARFAAANHLTLAQAHKLVSGALHGNVADYNKLNIEVLPKSATLAQNLAQAQGILNAKYGTEGTAATKTWSGVQAQLIAVVKDLAANIGEKLLPYLSAFGHWLITTGIPWIEKLGARITPVAKLIGGLFLTGIKAIIGAFQALPGPFKIAIGVIGGLAGAWWLVNFAMDANPVMAIIAAIVLLVGAVVKYWPQIKEGILTAWHAIHDYALAPMSDFFTKTIPAALGGAKNWIINNFIRPVINAFLGFAGMFVHGAATAFGWIPGIGSGLKNAAKAFDTFRRNVNASLDALSGKTVAVNAQFKAVAGGTRTQGGFAGGGQVRGPGSGTSDSIPAWLSHGEYVVSAAAVARYGPALLDAINAQRFASGGLVLSTRFPSRASIDRADAAALQATANAAASAILAALAAGGPALGGNVTGWIMAALAATGEPASWLPALLRLVSKESGGNPRAVNPVTVMGEHASGLFQMLPSTFAQFATVAGGIFNAIANAVAALRYIAARYGSPFNIPNLFGGNYVGYAGGGLITEPILGVGRSGRMYGFGENGPERVTPGRGGGAAYHFHFSGPVASREAAKTMVLDAVRDLQRERRLP